MFPLHAAPSLPIISIVHSRSSVIVGQPLTLTCSTSIQEGINGSPTLTWTKDGLEQPGVSASGSLSLPIIALHTSHGGVYICTARLIIQKAGVNISESNMTTITVQSMQYNLSFLYN